MTTDEDMLSLVGFGCESFLYGCYTILFAMSVYLRLNSPNRANNVKALLFIMSVFLYLSSSGHFILEFVHFYHVLSTTGVKGFANYDTSTVIGSGLLLSLADFFGELILMHRCWVLWSKNYWIIIVPSLSAITGLVGPVPPASNVRWNLAAFVIVTASNAMRRDVLGPNFPTRTGRAAFAIVVESGMLYLAVQLCFIILYSIRHPAQAIISMMAVQIYGIAPTLIFIRMSGLLYTESGVIHGGVTSVSLPVSIQFVSSHGSGGTTVSTDPGLRIATEVPKSNIDSEQKPSDGGLGSNLISVENAITE
ncbi:hypothetical protein BJV77DRAFT_1083334 [Russula vinacea]|nr:hypothetical protein BJV77DRAFT_1083334 [Russula vinacea]